MANRPLGAGGGLSSGLRRLQDRRERKKAGEQESQQAGAEKLAESIKESEASTLERQEQILAEREKAVQGGATTPEQLQSFDQAAFANLDMHAEFLEELKANGEALGVDMSALSGQRFLDQNTPVIQSAIDASGFQKEEGFEILSPEAIAREIPQLENTDAIVQRNKATGKIELLFPSGGNESTIAERIRLLTPLMGEDRATLVATTAAVVVTDPVTGISGVINKGTGDQIGPTIEPPAAPAEETTVIPDDIKTSAATGVKGMVINVANTVRDAFGMGLQDPEAQDATDALTTIQTLTSLHLLQEISGRDTDGLRKRLDKLTVTPNSFFQGEERSKNRLQDTQQVLQGEIDRMENQLKTEIDPATKIKLQNNIPQIKRLRDAYGTLVTGFDKEEEEVDVEGERLLDKHAPIAGSKKEEDE